jgi:hypothetical protein
LLWLVLLDAVVKVLAYSVLPLDVAVNLPVGGLLILQINELGLGSWGRGAFQADLAVWQGAFSTVAIGVVLLTTASRRIGLGALVGYCVGASVGGAVLASGLGDLLIGLGHNLAVFAMRGGQALMWTAIWSRSSHPWRLGCLLGAAAAVGNFLSLVYPPFKVIDFFYSTWLSEITGMGVVNLADVFYLMVLPAFASGIAEWLWRRARRLPQRG